jgi:hypothetical protein
MLEGIMSDFNEWVRNERTQIEAALELAVIDWLKAQDVGFDDNFIDLDGNHHGLAGEGENKGKVSYCGSIQNNAKGVPYATCTVAFQRASEPNRTFKDSYEVVRQMWEDYKAGNTNTQQRVSNYQRDLKAEKQRRSTKAKSEAARKAENVERELVIFDGLSNDIKDDPNTYLSKKRLSDIIPRDTVRDGSDKRGHFVAIQLIKVTDLSKPVQNRQPVGIQRFYDRNIKGRDTNKDFTWGMTKGGACHLLGEISKDYAGLLPVCEGFADGVVAHHYGQVPVIVGLDKDNLDSVAQVAKEQFPKATVMPICDNDAHKYKQGVDNGGVLSGVKAAMNAGGKYVIPDFSSYDQSGKPKDLWDLWDLGGDEAVIKLLNEPQEPPENLDEFRLNYLGLESFWKELDGIIKSNHEPDNPNPRKTIEAALEFAKPHLERLGIDEQAVLDRIDEVVPNAELEFLKRGIDAHNSRLAKADEEVYIERDLKGIKLDNYRTLVVESGLGTGKTEKIKKDIFQNPRFERILIITPRKVLAIAFSKRLSATYYEDVKSAPIEERHYMMDRLVAVSNSLKKLGLTGNERFDAVVLDEVELNILHVFGGTFSSGEREDTLNILKGLIKNAGFVFCCQAQITKLTLDFLRDSGRFDAHVIRNKSQRYEGFSVELLEQKADCAVRLMQCIEKGEPVIVPCTSSTFVKGLEAALKQKYPDKRISAVHSDNSDDPEPKKILEDPNKNTIGIDALLHSPVLEQGVSIDNGWFKHEVGFCDAGDGIGAPDSFTQMMFRARHILDAAIWVDPRVEDKTTDYVKILADERANFEVTKEALVEASDGELTLNVSLKVTKNDVLRAKAQAATNAAKNHTKAEVYAILHEMGCSIKNREWIEVDNEAGEELLKEGKKLQKQNYETSTVAAPQITRPDYEKLRRASASTSDDAAKMERHKLERYTAVDLGTIDESERRNVFDFWKNGRGLKKLDRREIMALSKKQALAYAESLLYRNPTQAVRGFWPQWVLLNWILESYGGRFSDDGRLESDGRWIVRDDLRGHKTYEWVKDNREVVNSVGLGATVKGNEPTNDELGLLITATGLPIESKRVDEDKLDEYVHKNVNGDQKSVQGSPIVLYKNKGPPAQKMITIENRKLVSVFTIDQSATVLKPPKATDDIGMRVFRWLVGALGVLVGLRVLDDGRVECDADKVFRLDDLRQGQDYQWILDNRDAINKAKLGARIKDDAPSNKALGLWLRKFGFKLISKRVSDKSAGKEPQKQRKQITISRLNPDLEHDFLKENLPRRLKTGDLYYRQAAQNWLDQKAKEVAEFGTVLQTETEIEPSTARLTIRLGILRSLHIRWDNGKPIYDPDFAFRFEDLTSEPWYKWACEHKDVVNAAGLGAKFSGDAPSVQVLTAWIKAMGIELSSKRIDARKLLIDKGGKNETSSNTGGGQVGLDKKEAVDHLNKSVGVENNSSKNSDLKDHKRKRVNAYQLKPKCLQKVREILDKDEHERERELETALTPTRDESLRKRAEAYLENHRGEALLLKDVAEVFGVKPNDLLKAAWFIDGIEFPNYDRLARIRLPKATERVVLDEPEWEWLDDEVPY